MTLRECAEAMRLLREQHLAVFRLLVTLEEDNELDGPAALQALKELTERVRVFLAHGKVA